MNIAIIAYPGKYTIAPSLKAVLSWCRESGTGCYAIRSLFAVAEMKAEGVLHAVETDLQALEQADVVVTIGGDGTMLHTAQQIRRFDLPVLGINSGRLGFMANVQHNQIGAALETVSRGEYRLDERFMLEATINGGKTFHALNEFLFTKKDTTSLVTINADYDGHFINRYWADGLIVASPTGSTAYNLSSGGPIVMPGTEVMVVTPINPHTLTTRPLVLPSTKELTVRMDENIEHILFSHDGDLMEVEKRPLEVTVRRSSYSLKLIQLPGQNYFDTLRTKLMWGMDSRS